MLGSSLVFEGGCGAGGGLGGGQLCANVRACEGFPPGAPHRWGPAFAGIKKDFVQKCDPRRESGLTISSQIPFPVPRSAPRRAGGRWNQKTALQKRMHMSAHAKSHPVPGTCLWCVRAWRSGGEGVSSVWITHGHLFLQTGSKQLRDFASLLTFSSKHVFLACC